MGMCQVFMLNKASQLLLTKIDPTLFKTVQKQTMNLSRQEGPKNVKSTNAQNILCHVTPLYSTQCHLCSRKGLHSYQKFHNHITQFKLYSPYDPAIGKYIIIIMVLFKEISFTIQAYLSVRRHSNQHSGRSLRHLDLIDQIQLNYIYSPLVVTIF